MGRNNRDYKIKDKNLTRNKKNAKLNKSIAFTLASMATIGAGTMIGGQLHEAEAMLGRIGSSVVKVSKSVNFKMPTSKPTTNVVTSRALRGAPGAINSGNLGSNGTSFQGLPRTVRSVDNTNFKPQNPQRNLSTTSGLKSNQKFSSKVTSLKGKFEVSNNGGGKNNLLSPKTSTQQPSNSKTGEQDKPVFTTQGFYRK